MAVELSEPNIMNLESRSIETYKINIEKESLPFIHSSVDIIIANQILEHTKEVFWIFHEISRVLPINGKLIIGIPNLASLHNRILLMVGRQPTQTKTCSAHVRGFTKRDILSFIENCFAGGYRLRNFAGSNFYPFPPFLAKSLSKVFPTLAWGIFFLFEKQKKYEDEFLEYLIKEHLETNFYIGEQEQSK